MRKDREEWGERNEERGMSREEWGERNEESKLRISDKKTS